MNLDELMKQHPCLVSPEDMVGICQPLQRLGIVYFGHAIAHADGSVSGICNNSAYLHLYIKQRFYNIDLHVEDHIGAVDHVLWDYVPQVKEAKDYYQSAIDFHLYHTFSLIKPDYVNNQTHLYHFSAGRFQPSMNAFYIHHRNLLEQFILYYTEQLNNNLNLKKGHTLVMPIERPELSSHLINIEQPLLTEEVINDFLQAISISPTEQTDPFALDTQILSAREKQCLYLLARGNSAKTIAKSLGLSPRTVYFYIENMKKKVGYHKKNQLVDYYWKYFSDDK